ncbi:hypothetical protein [Shewanella marina]|uniref:hypothetical protein n=1 Tax=Shewanella marina TaxID=487319 RepID=UPI00047069AD|nr:hypothetical protein [Shewanella marina]
MSALTHKLSDSDFSAGLALYLQHNSFKQAGIKQLIKAFSQASQQDLNSWYQSFKLEQNPTQLSYQLQCEQGKVSVLTLDVISLNQQAIANRIVTLTSYTQGLHELHKQQTQTLPLTGAVTQVKQLIGYRCPNLILATTANNEHFYSLFSQASLQTIKSSLNKIKDSQIRQQIWQQLGKNLMAEKMDTRSYLQTVFVNYADEDKLAILQLIAAQLEQLQATPTLWRSLPQGYQQRVQQGLRQLAQRRIMQLPANSELTQFWQTQLNK